MKSCAERAARDVGSQILIAYLYTRDQTLASVALNDPNICHSIQNRLKRRSRFPAQLDKRLSVATNTKSGLHKVVPRGIQPRHPNPWFACGPLSVTRTEGVEVDRQISSLATSHGQLIIFDSICVSESRVDAQFSTS